MSSSLPVWPSFPPPVSSSVVEWEASLLWSQSTPASVQRSLDHLPLPDLGHVASRQGRADGNALSSRQVFLNERGSRKEPSAREARRGQEDQGAFNNLVWRSGQVAKSLSSMLLRLSYLSSQLVTSVNQGQDSVMQKRSLAFLEARNWANSALRCLQWHPQAPKLALAFQDDTIRVLYSKLPSRPVLKSREQRNVTCLAWRPLCASELAVGCSTGLLLWTIDPESVATRLSSGCLRVLRYGHSNITCLQWDPNGRFLVSASLSDSSFLVWNTDLNSSSPVRRLSLLPQFMSSTLSGVSMAPDGLKVAAFNKDKHLGVYDVTNWIHADSWTFNHGYIQSCCWSPCGSVLLFATSDEPSVFCLRYDGSRPCQMNAHRVLDLTEMHLDEENRAVGGLVHSMKWDPSGSRLAVLFKESNFVAIFSTAIRLTQVTFTPLGLVGPASDDPKEEPASIHFSKGLNWDGALLSIAWSGGRLQHLPMHFVSLKVDAANPLMKQPRVVLNPDLEASFVRGLTANDDDDSQFQLYSTPKD